jgi:hypothetical protein
MTRASRIASTVRTITCRWSETVLYRQGVRFSPAMRKTTDAQPNEINMYGIKIISELETLSKLPLSATAMSVADATKRRSIDICVRRRKPSTPQPGCDLRSPGVPPYDQFLARIEPIECDNTATLRQIGPKLPRRSRAERLCFPYNLGIATANFRLLRRYRARLGRRELTPPLRRRKQCVAPAQEPVRNKPDPLLRGLVEVDQG